MNIFVTSKCPVESAIVLDDKRVVKMILESAQMLSTNLSLNECSEAPYKMVHKNHPCTIWSRQSRENYLWLLTHMKALADEYTNRYGKIHKSMNHYETFLHNAKYIENGKLTNFPNCTVFKDKQNINEAYRKYMCYKWDNDKREPKWTNASPPEWYERGLYVNGK